MFDPSKLLTVDNFYQKSTTVKPFDPSDPDLKYQTQDGSDFSYLGGMEKARFRYEHVADIVRKGHIRTSPFNASEFFRGSRKSYVVIPYGSQSDHRRRDHIIYLMTGFVNGDWSVYHTLFQRHINVAEKYYPDLRYRPELQDMYMITDDDIFGLTYGGEYFSGDISHQGGKFTVAFLESAKALHAQHDQYLAEQKKIKVNEAIALFEKEPHLFRPKTEAENKAQFDIKNLALIGGLGLATYLLISDTPQPKEELKIVVHDQG